MTEKKLKAHRFSTRAIRAGHRRTHESEQAEPLFLTSSFVFQDAAQAEARFAETEDGNIYSRFTNPTVNTFERRLASLEQAERCIGTASGMAAVMTTCLAMLRAGDHVISSRDIFGSTTKLFKDVLMRFGIEFDFVPLDDLDRWKNAFRGNTRMLYMETPSNPLGTIGDIGALANLAHENGARLVVDNCMATPALQLPLRSGADVVIHSATKFIDGQGRCVGGAVLGDENFVGEQVYKIMRSAGPSMSPFNAWVFLKGLETLQLRMKAISANALRIARWLNEQGAVSRVYYPLLPGQPQYELARRQQTAGGGIVSFEVEGGREAAWRVIDGTRLLSITANLGDVKTTITHPATTTHGRLSQDERDAAGIRESLVRISVGLEDIEDIQEDLSHGLTA